MTPGFALSLSHHGITLLRRGGDEWLVVGSVPLQDPDLADRLTALRETALDQARGGPFATKLILPNSQILYTQTRASGSGEIADTQQVADTLEGATPYALPDLVYDWVRQGDVLHIAAVARETLDEAEDFAAGHRLDPVCFVAAPQDGEFPGEPWFGETAMALDVLPAGESIDRDGEAVRWSDSEAEAPAPTETPSPDPAPWEGSLSDPLEPEVSSGDDAGVSAPDALGRAPLFTSIRNVRPTPAIRDVRTETVKELPAEIVEDHAAPPQAEDPGVMPPDGASTIKAPPADPTPPPIGTRPEQTSTESPRPKPTHGKPPPPRVVPTHDQPVPQRVEPVPPSTGKSAARQTARVVPTRALGHSDLAAKPPEKYLTDKEAMTVFGARKPPKKTAQTGKLTIAAGIVMMAIVGATAYWSLNSTQTGSDPRTPPVVSQIEPPAPTVPESPEAEAASGPVAPTMPVDPEFADQQTEQPGEGPLITDAGSVGLGTDQAAQDPDAPPPQLDAGVARTAYAATGIWQRSPERGYVPPEDGLNDLYIASIDPVIANQDAFALPDDLPTADGRPRVPPVPRHPNDEVVVGTDGLVVATPSGTLSPGGVRIYQGQPFIVPPVRPQALATELAPPSGDANDPLSEFRPRQRPTGLIETNEKAVLGGRTLAELGRLRPRDRPRSLQDTARQLEAAQRMADAETAEGQAIEDAVAAAVAADLASATSRAIAASPEPRPRPSNIAQLADRARRITAENERQVARAKAQAETAARDGAKQRALASAQQQQKAEESRRKEAEAQAAAQKQKQQDAAKAAAAASTASRSNPKAPAVSRSQRLKVKTSTPASVARQATLKNALSLNKVALIGVYGTSSQRRALVRLPSGKYVKVKVGDRIDGGRVATIGKSDLRYTKSGRSVTIKMPKG